MRKRLQKRGVSVYLSWVLVVGIAVALSVVMYNYTFASVDRTNEQIERIAGANLCKEVSFNVDSMCQNTQSLYMNITNTLNIRVDILQFRLIDLYGGIETKEKPIDLFPGDTEYEFTILKQGTLANMRIIPIILKEDTEIICQEAAIEYENIPQC